MGSQQRSPLMRNEKFTPGSAVSDGFEEPSDRAELVIVLRNVAGGEPVIWHREDDRTDDNAGGEPVIWHREDDRTDDNVWWFTTLLRFGLGG
jgi:hypothetical protein